MAGSDEPTPEQTSVVDTEPTNTPDQFSFKNATFEEVLEELSSRFILNLPEDELAEVERVCFQVEQAHWYYEDFIRDANPSFPSFSLKRFSEILFHSCPLLHHWSHDHETAFNGFMNYKTRVPVCGAIMLNEAMTKCILVKGWKSSAGWGFPKGKVNENEDEADCAVREVLEETGYSLQGKIRRADCVRLCIKQQPITLFVVPGIPEDFPFKTQTRKEISKIDWFKLADLPTWKKITSSTNKFYLITPVIGPLKAIVRSLRKIRKAVKQQSIEVVQNVSMSELDDQPLLDDATGSIALESPVTTDPSPRSRSGEAEASSSQSSSIDPHTPSVNGDLAPHTSGDTLVVTHKFPTDVADIVLDTDMEGPLGVMLSNSNADPRSHWSRLMTRLNHSNSEENSPRESPQALTPTPPTASNPIKSEHPSHSPQPSLNRTRLINGSTCTEHPFRRLAEHADAIISPGTSKKHSNFVARSITVSSFPTPEKASIVPTPDPPSLGFSAPSRMASQTPSSPDALVTRTRQLRLLDAILAEESTKQTPQPPMSAHILGAYPRPPDVPFQDHLHMPVRPSSVNPDVPRTLSTSFHHQPKFSASTLSGVLPVIAPASAQHQSIYPPPTQALRYPPRVNPGPTTIGRPSTASLSQPQPYMAPYPAQNLVLHGNVPDATHRGQMLSILSRGAPALPSGPIVAGFRPGNAVYASGPSPNLSTHGHFSSTSIVTPAPNAHLLSLLNNASVTGRTSPAPMSIQRGL